MGEDEAELPFDEIARYIVGFYQGERIDWDDALDRVEVALGIDLPDQMLHPTIKAIKRAVRKERAAAAE
jgi:hypothetical protein